MASTLHDAAPCLARLRTSWFWCSPTRPARSSTRSVTAKFGASYRAPTLVFEAGASQTSPSGQISPSAKSVLVDSNEEFRCNRSLSIRGPFYEDTLRDLRWHAGPVCLRTTSPDAAELRCKQRRKRAVSTRVRHMSPSRKQRPGTIASSAPRARTRSDFDRIDHRPDGRTGAATNACRPCGRR